VELVARYDAVLLDLDGVVYRGDEPVAGAAEAVARLRAEAKGIAFLTNNSARTPEQVAEKLNRLGIRVDPGEVATSAVATAALLASRGGGSAFVIGEAGVRTALADHGIEVLDGEPDRADYVVVGWDRGVDYGKLKTGALLVQRGSRLVATNSDASYPGPDGLWPGAGALLAAIVTATGATPDIVGKPHAPLFEVARETAGGGAALSVGDRLDTDVAGAAALGWDSLLLFTGVTTPRDLLWAEPLPTFVGRDLSALFSEGMTVRPAVPTDTRFLETLLAGSGLEADGTGDRVEGTLVGDRGGDVVGTAAVELHGALAHLRSVAVEESVRHAYLGTRLVAAAVRDARRSGAREIYLATETAGPFFEGLGFAPAGRLDALPQPFRDRMSSCHDTAVVMRLDL
jgi:glycerol-1-phosphatase